MDTQTNDNKTIDRQVNLSFDSSSNNMVQNYLRKIVKWNNKDLEIIFYKGQFWFKAKGVAKILDYKDTNDAIRTHVPEKNKKKFIEFLPPAKDKIRERGRIKC